MVQIHQLMTIRSLYFLAALVLAISACSESNFEEINLDLGYEYYPLAIGQSRTYAVDSIIYDPVRVTGRIDTLSSFIREDIVDTFYDNSGALVYRIERYYRKSETEDWQIHSVVSSSRTDEEAVYTENNLRFIKLRFPLKAASEWKGTAHFPADTEVEIAGESLVFYKDWQTTVIDRQDNYDLDGTIYSDVYLLELANFENLIEYRYATEAYAPDRGLIYQEVWVLDTQCDFCCGGDFAACGGFPWEEKAEKGLILKKRLVE